MKKLINYVITHFLSLAYSFNSEVRQSRQHGCCLIRRLLLPVIIKRSKIRQKTYVFVLRLNFTYSLSFYKRK